MASSAVALSACAGAEEAPRVELPVRAARLLEAVETDLGYRIELGEARLVVHGLEFAIGGEAHVSSWTQRIADWLVPIATAHPGHLSGGEVTGELPGRFVISWRPAVETPLGTASLIAGDYESANFTLASGTGADGLGPNDPLLGHTMSLRGTASRGPERHQFSALVDADGERELAGIPFAVRVPSDASMSLGLELLLGDPFEGDTLFDAIDFGAIPQDDAGVVVVAAGASHASARDAHARLARAIQTPDHFRLREVD